MESWSNSLRRSILKSTVHTAGYVRYANRKVFLYLCKFLALGRLPSLTRRNQTRVIFIGVGTFTCLRSTPLLTLSNYEDSPRLTAPRTSASAFP